jgi:creatinine amidohydrolase/Fe(II)-dependent formamide hydrolase-like protein
MFAYLAIDIPSRPVYVAPQDLGEPNPLPLSDTLNLEKMTWMEVRDRVRNGYTRIIIPTGGIEQNGPFVALNKHDLIVKEVSMRVARTVGNTLVAPVVSFVPEGHLDPKTGHMRYPGTISISEKTFEGLLHDIAKSFAVHGFTEILLVGDSGDSQPSLRRVAERLSKRWEASGAAVRYIPEFYDYAQVRQILKEQGISETPEAFHEELAFSLQLLAIDPSAIRYVERLRAGRGTLGGVTLSDREKLQAIGETILRQRVVRISEAIRRYM